MKPQITCLPFRSLRETTVRQTAPSQTAELAKEQAMSIYPSLSTRVIGQAEKSVNAILERQLAGTGLTETQ
jgi:hypothetical protein